jgi:hypothetical protein
MTGAEVLARYGITPEPGPAASPARFLAAVEAAVAAGVTVNRVSQGSGAMLLAQAELGEMARIGADHGIEVSLFVGPREEWDTGRSAQAADSPALAGRLRGARQLRYAVDDVLRAVDQGIRGFLVAEPMKRRGDQGCLGRAELGR